ncbi:DEKNAAC102717 [Brettanomyces naardenensis]|uniref:DEKNAAC102717 n=1 Tax=Brettanomyces naardenensis TaxID=13370 RepID=A0A448YLS3_BRENA|nr:DEKNAAC102717 [Brettanomyces naardenensis]
MDVPKVVSSRRGGRSGKVGKRRAGGGRLRFKRRGGKDEGNLRGGGGGQEENEDERTGRERAGDERGDHEDAGRGQMSHRRTSHGGNKDQSTRHSRTRHQSRQTDDPGVPHPGTPQPSPTELREYGPEINGYRFVATDAKDVVGNGEEKEKESGTDEEDAGIDDYPSDSFGDGDSDSDTYTYTAYARQWEDIVSSGQLPASIPLPVASNSVDDLDVEHVRLFLNTKERIRSERLRWHPDKMIVRLEKLGVTEERAGRYKEIVTMVSQVINSLATNR